MKLIQSKLCIKMIFLYYVCIWQEHLEGQDACVFICPSNQQFKNIESTHLSGKF